MRGFWTEKVVAAYLAELAPVRAAVERTRQVYDVLCDATDWQVQSPAVQARLRSYFEQPWPGRRAFVMPGALLRLQAARVIPWVVEGDRTRIFATPAMAAAWLHDDVAARVA